MKLRNVFLVTCFLFLCETTIGQTLEGVVLDAKTKTPIETATVYFDNTTLGVITNSNGEFSIRYTKAIQSPLIISFLGYKKQIISDYRSKNKITVLLEENTEALSEVLVNANDGMTRRQKLKFFRKEFLGTSRFGNSCKILNEDDIVIRYNKKEKVLTAYSKAPLQIENKALQYVITYDVTTFTLKFHPLNKSFNPFDVASVGFYGTTFYKDLKIFNKAKAFKNRANAYEGSRLEFMRALYAGKLTERGYEIYDGKNKVTPKDYFKIEHKNNSSIKRVSIEQPLNILYGRWEQSSIYFLTPAIFIDFYGNYTNVDKVQFSGVMGKQRVGELLPFDYGL